MEKTVDAWFIPDEVEGEKDREGVLHISKIYLKDPVIYFNLADIKEKREVAQRIHVIYHP